MEKLNRTWAEIDLDNLRHNVEQLRGLLKDGVSLMAVVKADAYGHGDIEIANELRDLADWYGVSNLMEARRLRLAGLQQPILILGYTPPENAYELFELGVTQTVLGEDYAAALSAAAVEAGVKLDVHIKVDTGMSRVGFSAVDADACARAIEKAVYLPALRAKGIFTHFAVADEEDAASAAFTEQQHDRFSEVIWQLKQRGIEFEQVHCCNSAAMVTLSSYHHTMVRPGIVLYGCSPTGERIPGLDLRPVMTLKSTVSMVKTLPAGETVSYGRRFAATEDMQVATVAVGYADGYPRLLSGKGYAFVCDCVVPILGNICMDQLMLDVTGLPVKEGDTVTLFGGDSPISVDNVAALASTIHYEVLCGVSRRVERVYIKGGEVCSVVDYTVKL
ncbi:MAG: alanine racemase [Oscillospiraceae bacterium]|nr:alanine racemase [Oscillospiraceae bacterium]MBQ9959927.1 alanine racemase [Oscillospiraceae bacterium]